jgi:hypothetical protein
MMTESDSSMAANAICHAASMVQEEFRAAISHYTQNHILYKPRLFIDGNQWCALFGDNLQDGVAGFGDSPAEAMWDFDKQWHKKLPKENNHDQA